MNRSPLIDGIASAVVTTSDRTRLISFFRDVLGWDVSDEVIVEAETARHVWGTDEARITVLTAGGSDTGRVHLFEADGIDPTKGTRPTGTDLGLFGIDVYVRDVNDVRTRCRSAHVDWGSGPETWQLEAKGGQVTVQQGRIDAPDVLNVVPVTAGAPRATEAWTNDPDAYSTELTSVVIATSDVDRSIAYWGSDGMGLHVEYDARFVHPALSALVDAPTDEEFRMAFGVGRRTARLEILGRSAGNSVGRDLRTEQSPGSATGMSALGLRTADLESAISITLDHGGEVVSQPIELAESPYGLPRLAVVRTTDGTILELAG